MTKVEPASLPHPLSPDERRIRRVRRLFAALFAFVFVTYFIVVLINYRDTGILDFVPAWGRAVNLVAALIYFVLSRDVIPERVLPRHRRYMTASAVAIIGVWISSILYIVEVQEMGRIAAMLGAILGFVLITQTIPPRHMVYWLASLAIGTLLLTIVDLYWPYSRNLLAEGQRVAAYPLIALALVLMLAIVVRDVQDYTLRSKLIGTTLFLTLVIVGVTTYAVGRVIRQTVGEQAEERLHVLTQSQALALGELLARQVNTLQTLTFNSLIQAAAAAQSQAYSGSIEEIQAQLEQANLRWQRSRDDDPFLQEYLNNTLAAELKKYVTAFPENADLFITDRYGAVIAMNQRTANYYHADAEWWIETYNSGFGGIYVSRPDDFRGSPVLGITIAVPIFSEPEEGQAKEFVGTLHTIYRVDALSDFLGQEDIGENNRIDLYFDDNTLLRVIDGKVELETAPLSLSELDGLLPLPESIALVNYAGVNSLIARYPISTLTTEEFVNDLGWSMVLAQAETEAFAPVTAQQRTNILLGIGAVIVGGVAAAIVGQILTAPIIRLTDAAAEVAQGNLQTRVLVTAQDEIGLLGQSFNRMTDQLLDAITNLELRVADRTRALNISTEVGRRLSTILDRQQLVQETVEQVRDGFNYYHAHIYLFDQEKENLLLVGGTGQAGREMMARGHKIKAEQGLVGRAAATNLPIIVPDVSQEPGWLANPLLPDTKAEVAVPIAIGNEIVGVLDIQHNIVNGLQQQDADLLLSIANQVAIALQNTRLLEETQSRAESLAQVTHIKEKIQQTTSIESALQVAVRELGRVTKAQTAVVRLQTNGHKDHD